MAPSWAGPGLFYSPKDNILGSWPDPLRRCEMESAHRKSEWKSHESIPHDQKENFKIGLESKTRSVQKHDCSNHHKRQSTFWSLQIYHNPNRKGTKTNLIWVAVNRSNFSGRKKRGRTF